MAIMANCHRCGRLVNLSESGFCKSCGMNYWATPDGEKRFRDFIHPAPMQREGVIRRRLEGFKSFMVKIIKW